MLVFSMPYWDVSEDMVAACCLEAAAEGANLERFVRTGCLNVLLMDLKY